MRDVLCRSITWQKYVRREKEYIPADAPKDVASFILHRAGEWQFRPVNGVITTPTLRPDGTILQAAGYDPATRLILVDPPALPVMPERPTRDDAIAALGLLSELLVEFPFVDKSSRSVALSALMTPVVRAAMPVAPMHTALAHAAGSGKSYLFDVASAIATGQACQVIAAGRTEEETEKRLVACVLAGYPLFSIDNVNGELGGDFLCQVIERPIVSPRILGRSEQPRLVNRATVFATGNNIRLLGDMTRRSIVCSIDAGMERPELRTFQFDPVKQVLANRDRYVAAVLTIVRAYFVAGQPDRITPPLASFEAWSNTVRSALVWLGEADPVDTLSVARAEDPQLQELTAFLDAWRETIGTGPTRHCSASELLKKAKAQSMEYDDTGRPERTTSDKMYPSLCEAIEQLGIRDNPNALGKWLSNNKGRVVDRHRLASRSAGKGRGLRWYVEEVGRG
jgi:putative DNA primase/helicase